MCLFAAKASTQYPRFIFHLQGIIRWDDWVNEARVRKLTDENKELAQNLKKDLDAQRRPALLKTTLAGSKKKTAGSDLSSTRGSEERHSSVPAMGRGQKRGRDYEIDKVGSHASLLPSTITVGEPLLMRETSPSPFEEEPVRIASPCIYTSTFPHPRARFGSEDSTIRFNAICPSASTTPSTKTGDDTVRVATLNIPSFDLKFRTDGQDTGVAAAGLSSFTRPLKVKSEDITPTTTTTRLTPSTCRRDRSSNLMKRETASRSNIPLAAALPSAETILSKSPPREPRSNKPGMLTKYPDYPALETAWRQSDLHPQLQKLNVHDPANEAKRQFFAAQDPSLVLMLAGVPKEPTLLPLRIDPRSKTPFRKPKVSLGDPLVQGVNLTFQEESFHARPAIRLLVPDTLKAILVDDWENVTKNLSLVPLPSKTPVNAILDTYFDEEKGKRRLGSAEADLLEEVVAGVKEYFEKCLGRILLYRFEREQFFEQRQLWEAATGEYEGKGPGDVYGAEHLCRLFGSSNSSCPSSCPITLSLGPPSFLPCPFPLFSPFSLPSPSFPLTHT